MLKIINKVSYFFTSFFPKIVWSLPKNKSIVILNEGGSEFLFESLGNAEYFILKKRSIIYLKYLLVAILFDRKINIKEFEYSNKYKSHYF